VLVVVLVVIALLSLAAYTFSELMLSERLAADAFSRQLQARALADSGLAVVKEFLSQTAEEQESAGGVFDNPGRFRGNLVTDDGTPRGRGAFTITAPLLEDGQANEVRFGLENESAKLNLATLLLVEKQATAEAAARELLLQLPGMTNEIADAILDWIDADDEPREFGAEQDYYSSQTPAYGPANRVPDSLEDLLLVRGITPALLFGPDANRNGVIDPAEEGAADANGGVDAAAGVADRGWIGYFTIYSKEKNVNPDGEPRINLNEEDLEKLYGELEEALSTDWAKFIVAYRQYGPYTGGAAGRPIGGINLDLKQPARFPIQTVLDLVGPAVQVRVRSGNRNEQVVVETPFPNLPTVMNLYLPVLLDHCSANPNATIPGRININQAPRTILLGIPGMTEEIVEAILSKREQDESQAAPERRHETWLLMENVVTLEQMKSLMPFVTAGGSVYRAQVVGFFEQGGPAARLEAVIDATSESPRLLFWRELSHLGRGYSLSTLGATAAP
jgi:DNA uptake protein ComE-like DNA-binding protein